MHWKSSKGLKNNARCGQFNSVKGPVFAVIDLTPVKLFSSPEIDDALVTSEARDQMRSRRWVWSWGDEMDGILQGVLQREEK